MTLAGLDGLEAKIRGLLQLVQDLRQKNELLEEEIRCVRQSLTSQEELNRLWEKEHAEIESRIDKVLSDIGLLDEPVETSV
jgi:chromosome segregation ATPase